MSHIKRRYLHEMSSVSSTNEYNFKQINKLVTNTHTLLNTGYIQLNIWRHHLTLTEYA